MDGAIVLEGRKPHCKFKRHSGKGKRGTVALADFYFTFYYVFGVAAAQRSSTHTASYSCPIKSATFCLAASKMLTNTLHGEELLA